VDGALSAASVRGDMVVLGLADHAGKRLFGQRASGGSDVQFPLRLARRH